MSPLKNESVLGLNNVIIIYFYVYLIWRRLYCILDIQRVYIRYASGSDGLAHLTAQISTRTQAKYTNTAFLLKRDVKELKSG